MDARLSHGFAAVIPLSPVSSGQCEPPALAVRGAAAEALVPAIVRALKTYPHFVVLRGLAPGENRRRVERVVTAIAAAGGHSPGKLSFTRVQIDPDAAGRGGAVTHYSRTHQALPPHTDSAYSARPHSLVAFQMVRSDPGGGRSFIVPVADIVASLDSETLARLREPLFAFGKKDRPILWGRAGEESMRYYRAQMETALLLRGSAPLRGEAMLDTLDTVLARLARKREFALRDGEVLFVNNHKALHGRTSFAPDSRRLMFRYRAHACIFE